MCRRFFRWVFWLGDLFHFGWVGSVDGKGMGPWPIDMTCKLPGDRASADVLGHILFGLGSLGVFLSSKSLHQGTLQ